MSDLTYYRRLADNLFFNGLSSLEVLQFATYKPGKSFADVQAAIVEGRGKARFISEREAGCIALELEKVFEIDGAAFDTLYGLPDRRLE